MLSERYHFVGHTCLKERAKLGCVLRSYGPEAPQETYETELQRRTEEQRRERVALGADESGQSATKESKRSNVVALSAPLPDVWPVLPAVLIIEAPEHYQAFVTLFSDQSTKFSWGYAKETRYEEMWRGGG